MKLIIAGSRSITSLRTVADAFEASQFSWDEVEVLVNGGANGVDGLAESLVAQTEHIDIESYLVDEFLDDAPHPKVAPLLRNTEMAKNADGLLAVWDGQSTGTKDMIDKAEKHGLTVEIHRTDTQSLSDFV